MGKEALIPQVVGENILADPKRVKSVLKRVDELSSIIKGAYVELTELLYEVAQQQYYKTLKNADGEKYARFEEYVEDRLGWKERKGRYFVAIHKNLSVEGGVSREDLKELDWSKASQLARLPQDELKSDRLGEWVIPAWRRVRYARHRRCRRRRAPGKCRECRTAPKWGSCTTTHRKPRQASRSHLYPQTGCLCPCEAYRDPGAGGGNVSAEMVSHAASKSGLSAPSVPFPIPCPRSPGRHLGLRHR